MGQNLETGRAMDDESREVWITYRMTLDLPADATEDDIMNHPDVTAPPQAEIVDWGFSSAIRQFGAAIRQA